MNLMPKYTVLTDICTLGDVGKTVELDDTPAIAALVDAGHLKPGSKSSNTSPSDVGGNPEGND